MKKNRKFLAILLTIALLLPTGFKSSTVISTAITKNAAVEWANAQIGKGLDYDGQYGNQCVDLIKYYYAYFGVAGYATGNANAYITNKLPPGWTRVYSSYQAGDIAVWKTNHSCPTCGTTKYGHVGIITSADATGFNAVSQNHAGNAFCTSNWFYCSALACAIRPSYTAADTTPPSITNVKVSNVNAKGYTVTCTATDNVGVTKVEFPTWRVTDTSAGCTWYQGSKNGNTWTFTYTGAVFEDNYLTHIYAYDAAGNKKCVSAGNVYCKRTEAVYPVVDGGTYEIQSYLDSSKVMDISAASTADGGNVQLWTRDNTTAQKFKITSVKDGYYKITALCSNKVLDIYAANRTNGANVDQYSYNGTDAQLFRFVSAGNGYCYIISKLGSFVDVKDGAKKDGTNIQTWGFGSTANQSWKLNLLSTPSPTPMPTPTAKPTIEPTPTPTPTVKPTIEPTPTLTPTVKPTTATDSSEDDISKEQTPSDTDSFIQDDSYAKSNEVTDLTPKVTGLTVKNKKVRRLWCSWTKVDNAGYYDVVIATNRSFTKNKKRYIRLKNYCLTGKLKKKTYYVRVRVYKLDGNNVVHGKWSEIKKIKITN